MPLLNDFYTIREITQGDRYLISIELNPEHEIYKGHFPGNPVVPGVCQTQIVKECIEKIKGINIMLVSGDNIKFTAVLNPEKNKEVSISLLIKEKEGGIIYADATIAAPDTQFFSFKGNFKEM